MQWPADHPAVADPGLAPWAGGVDEILPHARVERVLDHLPGRRVTTLVTDHFGSAVVQVFAAPHAQGHSRRLHTLARGEAADLVPSVLGCDAAGHVLAITYREGVLPDYLPDSDYVGCLGAVGEALRRLHDSGTAFDRTWEWPSEIRQLADAPLVPAHCDLHPRQVVISRTGTAAFIELDNAAMAPRGLDVGSMLAHLHSEDVLSGRSTRARAAARDAFLAGYGTSPDLDEQVRGAWTALAQARLAGSTDAPSARAAAERPARLQLAGARSGDSAMPAAMLAAPVERPVRRTG